MDYNDSRPTYNSECSYADLYAVIERRVAPKPTRSFSIEDTKSVQKEEKRTRNAIRRAAQDQKEQRCAQAVNLPSVEKPKTKSSEDSRNSPKAVQRPTAIKSASSLPGPNESRLHHSRHISSTCTSSTHSPKCQGTSPVREHHTMHARRPITNESNRKTLPSSQQISNEKGLSPRPYTRTLGHVSTNTKSSKDNRNYGISKPSEDAAVRQESLERQTISPLPSMTHGKLHDRRMEGGSSHPKSRVVAAPTTCQAKSPLPSKTHGKLHGSRMEGGSSPPESRIVTTLTTCLAKSPLPSKTHGKLHGSRMEGGSSPPKSRIVTTLTTCQTKSPLPSKTHGKQHDGRMKGGNSHSGSRVVKAPTTC
jgi:hypothetical protein